MVVVTDARALAHAIREPTPEEARMLLAAGRLALGVGGWLTPNALARAYGVEGAQQPALVFTSRLFAVRDVAMGAGMLEADGADLDRWLRWGMLADAADGVAALLAGARRRLPWRRALLTAAAAGGAVYLGSVARRG